METMEELVGNTLSWVQGRALQRAYDLRFDGEAFGKLRFEKMFGSLATAESTAGTWTFKREGFVKPRVTVRVLGSETNIGVFSQNWGGGGMVEFASGNSYEWKCSNFLGSEWKFIAGKRAVLTFRLNASLLKNGAMVSVNSTAPELDILILLGWYLMVLTAEDMAATTSAIACA